MSKPRKLPESVVKRITLECAEIGGWLAARAARLSKANDWIDTCVSGNDYSRINRGGAEGTSVERAALTDRTDDTGLQAAEFMDTLHRWEKDGRKLRYLAVKLLVDWDEPASPGSTQTKGEAAEGIARRSHEAAGSGDCGNCGRVVSGSSRDRLRHGRCDACRMYWERNNTERPKELWGGDSIDGRCVAILTRHGQDYRCTRAVGHLDDHEFIGNMGTPDAPTAATG